MNKTCWAHVGPMICFLLLTLAGQASPAAPPEPSADGLRTVKFPNGPVQFSVPDTYIDRSEPEDTVAILPAKVSGITLRFNLHNLPGNLAKGFLESQAEGKKLKVKTIGGKPTISESGKNREGGVNYRMTFWQIAMEDGLVVMSAEVDEKRQADPAVKKCLAKVPQIIKSMRKVGDD